MDPITVTIIALLTGGATKIGEKIAKEAFDTLKADISLFRMVN